MSLSLEIGIMRILKHPNIINLLEVFESNKKIFIVMDFYEGGTLREI